MRAVVVDKSKGTDMRIEIELQQRCPCGLVDCEIYRQTPLAAKATDQDVFSIAKTVNNNGFRGIEPLYALLHSKNRYVDKDKVIESLEQMHKTCTECRQKHPVYTWDKRFRPARIRINFGGLFCAEEIYGFCVKNHLINPGR